MSSTASSFAESSSEASQWIGDWNDNSFDGALVSEGVGAPGLDSCYFSGSIYSPFTHITGGTWQVAGGELAGQHNRWGYDYVGWFKEAVDYYRTYGPSHGIVLPCGTTQFQTMSELCGSTCVPYTQGPGNVLTSDIRLMNVQSCRNDMSNSSCMTVNYCVAICQ